MGHNSSIALSGEVRFCSINLVFFKTFLDKVDNSHLNRM